MSTAQRLRVLVVGESADDNVCDVYRSRMFIPHLAGLGVEVRYALPSIPDDEPLDRDEWERRRTDGVDRLVAEADEADVIVFRRGYVTHILCFECDFATLDADLAMAHIRATHHSVNAGPNVAVRRFFELLESDSGAARRHAVIYETDDDWLRIDPTNGQQRAFRHERDLIERMIMRADLVTASTPILAARLESLATEVRVVRNAVDPAWYGEPASRASDSSVERGPDPRVLFYGSIGRVRDYAPYASAVDPIARRGARRVWLGAPSLESEVARVAHLFDEIHPYVPGVQAFARRLGELRPGIGLAPLSGSQFDQAKSELHWLEYSMAGAVTVATRRHGGGPYDVIRHGTDGFLVDSPADGARVLRRLAGSSGLRAEVVAAARARVLAEYEVGVRAIEWADAFRAAAANVGRGFGRQRVGIDGDRRAAARVPDPSVDSRAQRDAADPTPPATTGLAPIQAAQGGLPAPSILESYLAAQAFADRSPLRLLVGAGGSSTAAADDRPAGEGWLSVDTCGDPDLRHDVRFGLPFADGTVESVDARHVLDGLADLANVLLGEAFRVLRPGGTLTVRTADRAAALARQRTLHTEGVILVGESSRLPLFTADALEGLLERTGFSSIVPRSAADGQLIVVATR